MAFWIPVAIAVGAYLATGIVILLLITQWPLDLSRRDRLRLVALWPWAIRVMFR
jgi:hypothetical protein